jgi:hypothetical protein
MPNDFALPAPLDTQEGQDTYLTAAFASGHPVLIADAVNYLKATGQTLIVGPTTK